MNFKKSRNNKSLYLELSESPAETDARGRILIEKNIPGLDESSLLQLKGKKIRIHGKVVIIDTLKFPIVDIENRADIEVK